MKPQSRLNVRFPGNPGPPGLVARDGDELYAFLANTGNWQRSVEIETDFYFEQERLYLEVDANEIPGLIPGVHVFEEKGAAPKHLRTRRRQPPSDQHSSAALGIAFP